jgi:hypothetical protein
VRGIEGRSRYNCRPAFVADTFQVRGDSVEPIRPSLSCNLLSHEDGGATALKESKYVRP